MNQHTTAAPGRIANWLTMTMETWTELSQEGKSPTGNQLAQALAARLGADVHVIVGWLQGVEALATYAEADQQPTESALEEERQSVQAALRAVRPILEARLQRRLSQGDQEVRAVQCLRCGQGMESQGARQRSWRSTVGPVHLRRRYHWCQTCGQGRAVAQEQVGLPPGDYTAGVEELSSMMATTVPHEMAVALVGKMLGLALSSTGIQGLTERRGEAVVAQQDAEAAQLNPYEPNGLPREVERPVDTVATAPSVAYLELDGVLVMSREVRTEGTGEGRGGKGRTYHVGGREVKNAVLYEGKHCAQESDSRHCLLEKRYVSHLGEWQHLALLVWAQMVRLRFDQASVMVVLGDGAEWIRHLCAWLPIPVLLILDLFHVKHRVWEVAHALYGPTSLQAREWAHTQCERVEQGHALLVIEELRELRAKGAKAGELVESLITYLTNNLDRMDYPSYRAQGLRVGSGTVESTNYHVTGARLKLPGMRWSEKGAAEMARLRTDLFNGIWEARTRQFLKVA